jgi:uncharacterized protein YecT (DUF1311 family)
MTRLMIAIATAAVLSPAAFAFDCAKAKTDAEKTICSDPAAKTADDAMAAAYSAVMAKLPADQQKALKANQKFWLGQRDGICSGDQNTPACFVEQATRRTDYLNGDAESGPGTGHALMPWFMERAQSAKKCAANAALQKFGNDATPGELGFNHAVEALLASVEQDNGTRESSPDYQYDCDYSLVAELTYAAPDLIAANVAMFAYGGGAHGNYTQFPIVIDLKTGLAPDTEGLFSDAALKTLTETCSQDIRSKKMERYLEGGMSKTEAEQMLADTTADYADAVSEGVSNFSAWIIYADRAEVYFPPYAVGPYVEGDYTCTLPNALLKKNASSKGWIIP